LRFVIKIRKRLVRMERVPVRRENPWDGRLLLLPVKFHQKGEL
jgi:hypothetical protein